jgi:hypothetical protein
MHDSNKRAKTAEDEQDRLKKENEGLRALAEKAATEEPETPAAPKADAEEKPAESDDEVEKSLESLRQEYPEIAEPMIKMMHRQEKANDALRATIGTLKANDDKREADAKEVKDNEHYNAIARVHKDVDEILVEPLLDIWIDDLPALERAGAKAIRDNGSTEDVIELITNFKEANGYEVPAPPKGDSKLNKAKKLTNPSFRKSKGNTMQKGKKMKFTNEQIGKMTQEEYDANEPAIDAALAAGEVY